MGGKSLGAKSDHILWSSFDVNSDIFSIVNTMSDDDFPFKSLVKWQGDFHWGILVSIDKLSLDVFTIFNKELDHTYFEWLSLRNIHALNIIGLDSHVGV